MYSPHAIVMHILEGTSLVPPVEVQPVQTTQPVQPDINPDELLQYDDVLRPRNPILDGINKILQVKDSRLDQIKQIGKN